MTELSNELILDTLRTIIDPESGKDIVSLGLVSGIIIKGANVGFALDIGSGDPKTKEPLRQAAEDAVKAIKGVNSASVMLTAERQAGAPPPPPSMGHSHNSPGGRQAPPPPPKIELPTVKYIVAVASGKGGVGKSTVAVNLALALKSLGKSVGLLDADIYGPSQPRMLGANKQRPQADDERINPVEAYGIKSMSMGYLIEEDAPMIWRGPMVAGALSQLFSDVNWGDLDILIVDMPPGTGDAQLTLAQRVPVSGAVIVSTPQDIALIDARKGIEMFKKVGIPILGIVENMSVFHCPKCDEPTHIFGAGGARDTAKNLKTEFLGEVPLHLSIRETSDTGKPIVATSPDSLQAKTFIEIAEKVIAGLN
jgi:ATP-binding protein involved in chromosome partitioning